ncbi:MAG: FlgD immunoglobulin-like domain containing protein [Candidatus Eisenbacteria bacterium]
MSPEPFLARVACRRAALSCALALTVLAATPAHALRFVNWNVLNYPGTTAATRNPLYRTVLAPLNADVLITCEMVSQTGADQFLANLNVMDPGQWSASAFQNGGDTASELYFKSSKVQLLGQWAFYPNPGNLLRFVNVYRLKLVGYPANQGEFRVYGLHLKASQGFEAQRLAEATGLRDSLNAMPPGTHALVCGDYNFYTGLEPGMQKLVETQVNNTGRLYDPLGLQNVAWQDNTSMQIFWTQSPCKTGDTGCAPGAASGGLDDRFDLILPSDPWKDDLGFELVAGTYATVGNDGLHHNNSLQDPPTIPEGAAYASALHGVSDHLPVRVDLRVPVLASFSTAPIALGRVLVGAPGTQSRGVANFAAAPAEPLNYQWNAPPGFVAPGGPQTRAAGVNAADVLGVDTSTPGLRSGSIAYTSASSDASSGSVPVSATVLRHAVPSLDSIAVLAASTLDFGTHTAGTFTPQLVRVHNTGFDALQARLVLQSAAITGGDGHFLVAGAAPDTVSGVAATFQVTFDDAGATADSTYTAELSFGVADEPLPGATVVAPLSVQLAARLEGAPTTGVGPQRPTATLLRAPAPNPLRTESVLRFELAQGGDTQLEVFDASGRRVARLLHSTLEPGRYSVRWDGRGESGATLGAGLYFARLTAPASAPRAVRLAIVR